MERYDIRSMTLPELKETLSGLDLPSYKIGQIYRWLQRGVTSFQEMTDQSKAVREALEKTCYIACAEVERKQVSRIDGTVKYLLSLHDGECIESVVMQYHHGYSICISTQVGCRMGCTFCATGKSGFQRNLTASEMLAQIQTAQKDMNIRISNVVLMGMGEPLDNYDSVLRFLELATDEKGMKIGMRHISLSTCGLAERIRDLADRKLQLTLSVSLHAPNDRLRSQTMPVNRKWNVDALLRACRYYTETTNRRISFEYAMISGFSDTDACALELAQKLKGMLCHVNLIPVNDVTGNDYRKSSAGQLQRFQQILQEHGINATVRRTLGSDIDASCGQLRRRSKDAKACEFQN